MWRAAGMIVMAMTLIVGGDMAGKMLTSAGFSAFFVAWARFALAAVLLAPFCGISRVDIAGLWDWRLILRAALIAGGVSCILTALKTEPVANVFGGFFVGPIVAYVLAVLILKEVFSAPRAVLLAVSFVGVLIVVRPTAGISQGMALALLAGCFHGGYLVATRWLAGAYRPRFLLWSQLVIGTVLLAPIAIGDVPQIGSFAIIMLTLSALGSALGNLLLVLVNRTTPATVVAPLVYSQIIISAAYGWLIFAEVPDAMTYIGLSIIVVAGVSSIWAAKRGR